MTAEDPALSIRGCTATIDGDALRANLHTARDLAKGATVMPIVKANGYGHGLVRAAQHLAAAEVRDFGVATVEEGLALRKAGIGGRIVVFGGATWTRAPEILVAAELVPVLSAPEEIPQLVRALSVQGKTEPFEVHLGLDTGMSRVGVHVGDEPEKNLRPIWEALKSAPQLAVRGICSHYANADLCDEEMTRLQTQRFIAATRLTLDAGFQLQCAHLANSAAVLTEKSHPRVGDEALPGGLDILVRPGIMLYGASPLVDGEKQALLRPVMQWQAPIVARKKIPRGTKVSYGGTWTAPGEVEIAVIGVGYADGYSRLLSNKAEVILSGMRAPVVGRVCMDLMCVDVSEVVKKRGPGAARVGQSITLLGKDGDEAITALELAQMAQTIPYEIFTSVAARVDRV
jgi:alanine racemase